MENNDQQNIPTNKPTNTFTDPNDIVITKKHVHFFTYFLCVIVLLSVALYACLIMYRTNQVQTNSIGAPSPSFATTTPIVNTTGWQTYMNSQYGFSFQYPSDWKSQSLDTTETPESIFDLYKYYTPQSDTSNPESLQGVCKLGFFADPLDRKPGETMMQWNTRMEDIPNPYSTTTEVTYGSVKGIYTVGEEAGVTDSVYLPLSDTGVFGAVLYCGDDTREEGRAVFNKILSTFKFTSPQVDMTGWKTYMNSQYKFSLQYPTLGTEVDIYDRSPEDPQGLGVDFSYQDKTDNSARTAFGFSISQNIKKQSLKQWFEENVDYNYFLISNKSFDLVPVAGGGEMYVLDQFIPATYQGGSVADAYIMSPDKKYVFTFAKGQDPGDYSVQEYTSQILSTFKFTK